MDRSEQWKAGGDCRICRRFNFCHITTNPCKQHRIFIKAQIDRMVQARVGAGDMIKRVWQLNGKEPPQMQIVEKPESIEEWAEQHRNLKAEATP